MGELAARAWTKRLGDWETSDSLARSFREKREIFVIRGEGPTCAARFSAFLISLSYRQCPIRPYGAPSPRGEGCDTRIPSSNRAAKPPPPPLNLLNPLNPLNL